MNDDLYDQALTMLANAASWHDLRRQLDGAELLGPLGSARMDRLLLAWHRKQADELTDVALADEIRFWADGGSYASHLRGYQAPPPAVLIDSARARGWFCKPLGSGGVIVNPPEGRPLVLRTVGPGGQV